MMCPSPLSSWIRTSLASEQGMRVLSSLLGHVFEVRNVGQYICLDLKSVCACSVTEFRFYYLDLEPNLDIPFPYLTGAGTKEAILGL